MALSLAVLSLVSLGAVWAAHGAVRLCLRRRPPVPGAFSRPYRWADRVVWVGNTHLHPFSPRVRARQAESIARELTRLGDQPVLFLGDLNTVPPGCKDGDFPEGQRDVRSYRNDRTLGILGRAGLRMVTHRDETPFHTYPVGAPNRTLDYILFSRHWDVEDYGVVRDFTLSDHYPVEGAFRLRG